MPDRRQHQRVAFAEQAEAKVYRVDSLSDEDGRRVHAVVSDVSTGGVGLRLIHDLPLHAEVSLRVSFADPPSSFSHRGRICWASPGLSLGRRSIGIQFVGASAAHTAEWQRALGQPSGDKTAGDAILPR